MSIVRALSLKGIKPVLPLLLRSLITLPRAERLVLIFLASDALTKVTYDLFILSDPAKSTKMNLFEVC